MNVVDQLTESLTVDGPSGNPLDQLPLRQFLVFVARTHQRWMAEMAELLGLHLATVHGDLRTAIRTLVGTWRAGRRSTRTGAGSALPVYRARG